MAAAALGASSIDYFRTKYFETIASLYSAIVPKLVGEFSKFHSTAKDTEIKNLRDIASLFLKWKDSRKIQTGGVRYRYNELNRSVDVTRERNEYIFPKLNDYLLIGNEFDENDFKKKNVLLLGAGPAGLYLSILLKTSIPEINVFVVENRVFPSEDEDGKKLVRTLTRTRDFLFDTANFVKTGDDDVLFESIMSGISAANLEGLLKVSETKIDLFEKVFNTPAYDYLMISYTELRLAAAAQRIGVKIIHTTYDTDTKDPALIETYIKTNFVNDNLLAIFDATGGRIYNNFRNVAPKMPKTKNMNANVYEKAVPLETAVRKFMDTNIPFIAIGDSLIRADYTYSNGLAMNGLMILFFTMLFRETYVGTFATEVIARNKTRKQRRTRRSTRRRRRSV